MVVISQGSLIVIFCAFAVSLSVEADIVVRLIKETHKAYTDRRHRLPESQLLHHLHHPLQNLWRVSAHPSTIDTFLID